MNPSPHYATQAMVSAVLWIAFGVALIGGAFVESWSAEDPQRLVEDSGVSAAIGCGAVLITLGVLILTGVMLGTVGIGVVTLVVLAVNLVPLFIEMLTGTLKWSDFVFSPTSCLVLAVIVAVFVTGVLSLTGAASYRRWRRAKRLRR